MARPAENLYKRFWRKVGRGRSTNCWPWLGGRTTKGYGQFRFVTPGWRGTQRAHRMAFALWHLGDSVSPTALLAFLRRIPVMHHVCENKLCCNPRHLEPKQTKDHDKLHAMLRQQSHRYDGVTFAPRAQKRRIAGRK